MSSDKQKRWRRVRALFEEALDQPLGRRTAYLDRVCEGDLELRAEVESLLEADTGDGDDLLSTDYRDVAAEAVADLLHEVDEAEERTGEVLDSYRLLRRLGRGGMGSVYLAERVDDEVRQRVAIKILRRGLDTDDILRRFRSEQQILAGLDHPRITRFLGGGRTSDGLPYFVLEYVEGRPIDRYRRDADLDSRETLELFLQVCEAVQSAHENLIIHCDLKPANVLVADDGNVKLLDFGIAKVLRPDWHLTRATVLGNRPLTPEYAGPEQLRGDAVSTRTDVFSLGVLLVELLSGERPSVERRAGLAGALAGDLKNIAAKALAEDPSDRYGTVEQFADDLHRFLDGRPVHARAQTWRYRAQRFIQRNRLAVGLTCAVILSLLAGLAGTAWQRDRAIRSAESAERVVGFLTGVITSASPAYGPQRHTSVEDLLDAGMKRLNEDLREDPEVSARIAETLGEVYLSRSEMKEASRLFARALAYHRRFPDRREDQARVTVSLARSLGGQGHYTLGAAMLRDALHMRRSLHGDRHPKVAFTLTILSYFLGAVGMSEETMELRQESLDIRLEHFPPDHAQVLQGKNDLAAAFHNIGRCEESQRLHTELLATRREKAGDALNHGVAVSISNLSRVRFDRGEQEESIESLRQSLEMIREIMPADHVSPARVMVYLARMHAVRGEFDDAAALYEEALPILRETSGRHKFTVVAMIGLGRIALEEGRFDDAERLFEEGRTIITEIFPANSALEVWAGSAWGRLMLQSDRSPEEAVARLEAAAARYDSLPLIEAFRYDVARDLSVWASLRGDDAAARRWSELAASPACSDPSPSVMR